MDGLGMRRLGDVRMEWAAELGQLLVFVVYYGLWALQGRYNEDGKRKDKGNYGRMNLLLERQPSWQLRYKSVDFGEDFCTITLLIER